MLTSAGVPEPDAHVYAEGLRRGGALVTARVADDEAEAVLDVLRKASGINIEDLRRVYEQEGWSGFDENPPAPAEDEMEEDRDRNPLVPPVI